MNRAIPRFRTSVWTTSMKNSESAATLKLLVMEATGTPLMKSPTTRMQLTAQVACGIATVSILIFSDSSQLTNACGTQYACSLIGLILKQDQNEDMKEEENDFFDKHDQAKMSEPCLHCLHLHMHSLPGYRQDVLEIAWNLVLAAYLCKRAKEKRCIDSRHHSIH